MRSTGSIGKLFSSDTTDSPHEATERNIEVAISYGIRRGDCVIRSRSAEPWIDREAVHEAVMIALVNASKRYDPESGCSWFTFAQTRAEGAILDELRDQKRKHVRTVSVDTRCDGCGDRLVGKATRVMGKAYPHLDEWDEFLSESGVVPDESAQVVSRETCRQLLNILEDQELLNESEKKVLYQRYWCQRTLAESAEVMGVSASWVAKLEKSALEKLKSLVCPDA